MLPRRGEGRDEEARGGEGREGEGRGKLRPPFLKFLDPSLR